MRYRHIIFQHTPKCAGTSLRHMLERAFGRDQVTRDYEAGNIANPLSTFHIDPARYWRDARKLTLETVVIAGHIPIRKYAHIADAFRVATVRHPVPRTISQYCFWTRKRDMPPPLHHPIREYVTDNKLTILEFAQLPFVRRFYNKLFFRDAGAEDFDLIVDADHFDSGVAQMSRTIDHRLEVEKIGSLAQLDPASAEYQREVLADTELIEQITALLRHEIAMYDEICSWRPAALGRGS